MSTIEKKQLEKDFKRFTSRHFEKPSRCKNLDQIQFYIQELTSKIKELKGRFNYVPDHAYQLLAQYNNTQNTLIHREFRNTYKPIIC